MSFWAAAMGDALKAAVGSPDPSTQNGAVLWSIRNFNAKPAACNDIPQGVGSGSERWERPAKYAYVEHAERRVIYEAARRGWATEGATLICVWAACADCARAIVESGVRRLVRLAADNTDSSWRESIEIGDRILREGGVEIVELRADDVEIPPLRRDGKVWP